MSPPASWARRAPEERVLLNPALVAVVLHEAARGYADEVGSNLPYALGFVVPPVVLVQFIRDELPGTIATSFASWIDRNPKIRMRFAEVAESMTGVVREGLLYGNAGGVLSVDAASIRPMGLRPRSGGLVRSNTTEFQAIVKKSHFAGRWFANAGSTATVMALWGVRP